MSDLGDQIQDAIDEFNALGRGADWESVQEETFLPALQAALNDAERDDHDHSGEAINPSQVGSADDPADETYTDELSVSDSDPVTGGPVGDEGEFTLLNRATPTEYSESFSSTEWDNIFGGDNMVVWIPPLSILTNIDSLHVRLSARLENNTDGETTSLKVGKIVNEDDKEILTHSGNGQTTAITDAQPLNRDDTVTNIYPRAKVTGGTGTVKSLKYYLFGRIA